FGAFGGLTLLIIGVGLAFALKRTILNPLTSLAQSARRLSLGDYTARARSATNDEIGMLAQTFNEMAENVEQRTQELDASRQELAGWNVDLEDKIQQRTKELSALNAVITTVSQSLHLDSILNVTLTKILAVMDIEAGMVHLLDEKSDRLTIMGYHGLSPEYIKGVTRLEMGEGIVGRVVQSGEPIIVNGGVGDLKTAPMVGEKGEFQACISLPVKSKNKVLGALSLASYLPDKFEPETVRLLRAMGDAIGIAVENAIAAQSLEAVNKLREQLLEKLLSAQEEERRRIARELHDEASQSLAAVVLRLEDVASTLPSKYRDIRQKLNILKEQAIQTLEGIRNLALELRPSALDDLGLSKAIDWYARDFLAKRGLDAKIEVIGPKTKLPSNIETVLFRIIQEALTNVVKHAEASQVTVRLQLSNSTATVQVEDNGKGFDVKAALSGEGGQQSLGLHGMLERATLLGGTFNIRSEPGQGTCLSVEVPLVGGPVYNG
ncbi:MAG: GAF domain-containing protein, partial [Dehalococcoidales bacterium]